MAYVLGYFYADGGLEDSPNMRGKYIRFTSTDFELLEMVRNLMGSKHSIYKRDPKQKTHKVKYLLRIGNSSMYQNLIELGLYPKKSLTIQLPKVPKRYFRHFVRGYFDGDGCVSIERSRLKDNSFSIKRLHTSFTSGSNDFLLALAIRLHSEVGVFSKLYKNGAAYQLRYNTSSSSKLFAYIYGDNRKVRLERKFSLFSTFFAQRRRWINEDIQHILDDR